MSHGVPRRVVMSGFALPLAAGLGLRAVPALARQRQVPPGPELPGPPDVPGADVPSVGLPTFNEGSHDAVLTTATHEALTDAGITLVPAPGSTTVPASEAPSARLTLGVASAALNLLVGAVHFDGGFILTDDPDNGGGKESSRLTFSSFTSQLAEGEARAWVSRDDEPGERIPAFTYDLANSVIEIDGSTLTLRDYPLYLTDEAVDAIEEAFPEASVGTTQPFAQGSAVGDFELPADSPLIEGPATG